MRDHKCEYFKLTIKIGNCVLVSLVGATAFKRVSKVNKGLKSEKQLDLTAIKTFGAGIHSNV